MAENKEQYLGVYQLVGHVWGQVLSVHARSEEVVFEGRTRSEAKRAMLRYWSNTEQQRGVRLGEFKGRCAWMGETRIIYTRPVF